MWHFAWRNLLTRPLRTILALVGLSIPILGVLGLFCLSGGLRNLVGDTLSKIQGLMVLRDNAISPVFSHMRADAAETLRTIPGVRVVAPEVWEQAPQIEGVGYFSQGVKAAGNILRGDRQQTLQSLIDTPVIQGQDISAHAHLKSGVYPRALLPKDQGGGRFLDQSDRGRPHVVIPRKFAEKYRIAEGGTVRPRRVGDPLKIGSKTFRIIGIYETGSMFLDVIIIMDIDTARELLGVSKDQVSSFYVETEDPARNDEVARRIEAALPNVDARSMAEFQANFGTLMGHLDTFLMMTISLALVVGVVGIINTMLMSTTERFAEFGVLRTNGWSRGNVLALVTIESAYLGLLAGAFGCLLSWAGTALANQFLGGGLRLDITPELVALGLGLSVVMGTIGGLYPAWRVARLVPMDAIRLGAH
jgi:putative ABC transport system permease protein